MAQSSCLGGLNGPSSKYALGGCAIYSETTAYFRVANSERGSLFVTHRGTTGSACVSRPWMNYSCASFSVTRLEVWVGSDDCHI